MKVRLTHGKSEVLVEGLEDHKNKWTHARVLKTYSPKAPDLTTRFLSWADRQGHKATSVFGVAIEQVTR